MGQGLAHVPGGGQGGTAAPGCHGAVPWGGTGQEELRAGVGSTSAQPGFRGRTALLSKGRRFLALSFSFGLETEVSGQQQPGADPPGVFTAPCWPSAGPQPWPRAGSTRPGWSRGCASAAAWGRCAAAASRCPATRRCSGSRRGLGEKQARAVQGLGGAGLCPVPRSPTLGDELLLELLQELQVQQVVGRQRLLPNHRLHRLHVLADGVAGVLRGRGCPQDRRTPRVAPAGAAQLAAARLGKMPAWAWLPAPCSWHAWGHPEQGLCACVGAGQLELVGVF